jgi:tRNA 2-thiouridine synthesizing protein A
MTTTPTPDYVLDCSGTLCPMPVVRLRQEIDKIEAGEVIRVIATDPASWQDMPAFSRNTGHELLHSDRDDGKFVYYFRKTEEDEE